MRQSKRAKLALAGGIAATLALLLVTRRARAALPSPGGLGDLDALTRMLIAETGFARDEDEMAQIVFVALNRADRYGKTVAEIVDPSGRSPTWNMGERYLERFEDAPRNPRWDAAQGFVSEVLGGGYRNLGATSFVHPGGMPEPPCSGDRIATSTEYGERCLPPWIVEGTLVGGALFA